MFKNTKTYKVSTQTRLDKIFTNGLPVNSFIDKGRCAIGATFGEITNKSRCTIITVPNISILLGKKKGHPEIDIVWGDVTKEEVMKMLAERKPGHKIMTTPEGMGKIMIAAEANGRLTEVYNEWFLLLDEVHTFITETYRENILMPFEYFWEFKQKSIVSATPFSFTDKRFHDLDYYKIEFTKTLGLIDLINAPSVEGVLNHLLTNLTSFPGNLHVFLNSVKEIVKAIQNASLNECAIYCADDRNGNNLKTLGELTKYFVAEPIKGEYRKVNFYTARYFEGWDLYDENATMILVTNIHKPHTKIGVKTKGKQALGRLRGKPTHLIHITNCANTIEMKPLETFRKEYLHDAEFLIKQNDEYLIECQQQGIKPTEDERLIKYADINKNTKTATLNYMKLDQQINEAADNEIYNNIVYIKKDWEEGYFDVNCQYVNMPLETTTNMKRKSAATQLEEDYQTLLKIRSMQQSTMVFNMGQSIEHEILTKNPTAYQAWKLLDEKTMIELKYNVKKVKTAIILKENTLNEVKLLRLLNEAFKPGSYYNTETIKTKLQEFYNILNIRDESGKVKVATANQISSFGWFEVKDTKKKNSKGVEENVKLIIRPQFNLRMAA